MKEFGKSIKSFTKQADMVLLILCCITSVFGIILISSATNSFGSSSYVIIQSVAVFLGIIVYIIFSFIDIEIIADKWKTLLVFNILFIASLFIFGVEGGTGNRSWLRFSWFPVGIQPAEIVKITFVLLLAKQLTILQNKDLNSVSSVFMLVIHLGLMVGLIILASSDLGSALVYIFIFICMAFAAGLNLRWFLAGIAAVAVLTPVLWPFLREDQKNRILIIFDPSIDPDNLSVGWQASQSKTALGSGQLFGQGLYNGSQTQSSDTSLLPAKHTDFIFSAAGEELGLIGCVIIVLLLTAIILRCIYIAVKTKRTICALTCVGFAGMLIFQTFENIGMCLGITPVVGLTLPFISYGGSSIVTLFAAMGIISGIKMSPSSRRDIYRI